MPDNTPTVCEPIETSLADSVDQLERLQEMLTGEHQPGEPREDKPRLLRMIRDMQKKIAVLQDKLDACIAANPSRPDPSLRSLTLEAGVIVALLHLLYLRNLSLRLHNMGTGDHRHSTIDVRKKDAQGVLVSLSGFPRDLGQLHNTFDYHFNDINSTSIIVDSGSISTPSIRLEVIFETNDEEIIVNNWFNKDFELFTVTLILDLGVDGESGLLVFRPVKVETKVVVGHWHGDSEDSEIEDAFNTKIKEQLDSSAKTIGAALTDGFIATNKEFFDYKVKSVMRQGTAWVISYNQIPKS
jgi:hypothetical protein